MRLYIIARHRSNLTLTLYFDLWPWPWSRPCKVKNVEKFELCWTISSSISNQRYWHTGSRDVFLLSIRRHCMSQWRHKWRQNHIVEHNFGFNCHRDIVLGAFIYHCSTSIEFDVNLATLFTFVQWNQRRFILILDFYWLFDRHFLKEVLRFVPSPEQRIKHILWDLLELVYAK